MATPALLWESGSWEWKILSDLAYWRLKVIQCTFLVSMSFLNRDDDIVVVYELSDCSFLRFPTVLWEAFGGEKAISIPSGE